jgi:microcystin-dependent protein
MGVSSAQNNPVGFIPTGCVMPYAGSTSPAGWLLCAGQAVSRTDYGALFAVISTTYGTGDGSTTFNVPDLRGRVVAGVDNMGGTAASRLTSTTITGGGDAPGEIGGAQTHTLTGAQSGTSAHQHTVQFTNGWTPIIQNISTSGGGSGFVNWTNISPSEMVAANSTATNASQAHNNVQPTMVMNYIIKAVAY